MCVERVVLAAYFLLMKDTLISVSGFEIMFWHTDMMHRRLILGLYVGLYIRLGVKHAPSNQL